MLDLISAGLDNTPLNFNHLMGQLSQPYGMELQERAFKALLNLYNGSLMEAWEAVCYEMKCDEVLALVKETYRFFTVLPLGLPRQTTKDIIYNNARIPAGTTIFLNLYAANHDHRQFTNPMVFDPSRWIDPQTNKIRDKMFHFSFGEGSRKCPGNILATREIYALTCRMLLLFKIKLPKNPSYQMKLNPFDANLHPSATSFEPEEFRVLLEKRNINGSDDLHYRILKGRIQVQ